MNILVTGASRGIGAATLALLRATGHRAVGQSTLGGDGLIAGDFTDPAAPRAIWDAALAQLGTIDVLVNNAGIFEGIANDADDAAWHAAWGRMLAVNLQAAADLSRLAVAHFRTRGGGRIVNVASRSAHRGDSPQHWHYAASKGGIVSMTRTIARGYAREKILAFAVSPGFTADGMDDFFATPAGERILAEIPLGRVTRPGEVAEAIRWLAVDAPPSATGTILDLNGASHVR